jgi:hypothetical protein
MEGAGSITEYEAPIDTEWHRYFHTFTVASNYVSLTALGIYCELTDGVTISARNFKLEMAKRMGHRPHDSLGLWVRGKNLLPTLPSTSRGWASPSPEIRLGSITVNGTATGLAALRFLREGVCQQGRTP